MNNQQKPQSTKDKIRQMFLSGHILTSCGAAEQFITADLRRIITDLRRSGMNIADRWATSNGGKRYKEYFLQKDETPLKAVAPVIEPDHEECHEVEITAPLIEAQELPDTKRCMAGEQQKLFL